MISTNTPTPLRLIVVANRGPLRRSDGGWTPSVGGLTTALLPVLERQGGVWVGMKDEDDMPERLPYPEGDSRLLVRSVSLSADILDNYYYGMANTVLWPLSHYMIQNIELHRDYIDSYREANELFADAVLEEYQEGDAVWVQDYHLMLAPGLIRQARPEGRIAYFWHIPWPAMEVYRILPSARPLLRGMLGSDLIGFHVDEYVENFLESARVLLGARVEDNIVHWEGREVRVEAHPIGIDVGRFEEMAAQQEVADGAREIREEVGSEYLVIGIDRLDYTKGILSRLLAFERFLEDNPEYLGRVSFYQIATPSRTKVESYKQLKREVDEAVGRINGAFAQGDWMPVHYRYRTYTQEELCAFYRAADVALITPLRDGMNLVTQEFVAAAGKRGVLVLSELTGAAYLLPEALQVNPYDQEGLMRSIKEALEMDPAEAEERLQRLQATVRELNVHQWAEAFVDSMKSEHVHAASVEVELKHGN